jgi:hypothetical protein
MSDPIKEYIQNIKQEWQIAICERIHQEIHQAIPDVEERIQYSKPHFRKNGKYAAVLSSAKGWVSVTIFNATDLEAPEGFFEADGPPERKTVKILKDQTVDYDLLGKLIQQAAATL